MLNKKGTDKVLAIYWFVVLTIVAGGIFAMVYLFYGTPYDVRTLESQIFAEKIADCISNRGELSPDLFTGNQFNQDLGTGFTKDCNINFNVEDGYTENEIQYFYRVDFYSLSDLTNPVFTLSDGNSNWQSDCFITNKNDQQYVKLATCTERRFYALSNSGNQYLIQILSVIGKSEKNVKQ